MVVVGTSGGCGARCGTCRAEFKYLGAAFKKEGYMAYSPFEDSQSYHDSVAGRTVKEVSARHAPQQRQHEIVNVEFEAMCDRIEKQCDC